MSTLACFARPNTEAMSWWAAKVWNWYVWLCRLLIDLYYRLYGYGFSSALACCTSKSKDPGRGKIKLLKKYPTGQERPFSLVVSSSPRYDTPNNVSSPRHPTCKCKMLNPAWGVCKVKLPPTECSTDSATEFRIYAEIHRKKIDYKFFLICNAPCRSTVTFFSRVSTRFRGQRAITCGATY